VWRLIQFCNAPCNLRLKLVDVRQIRDHAPGLGLPKKHSNVFGRETVEVEAGNGLPAVVLKQDGAEVLCVA
jgi:hypothetical protein